MPSVRGPAVSEPVNILAGLADLSSGRPGDKWGLRVVTEGLWVDLDDDRVARDGAAGIQQVIRANMQSGRAPDGAALPGAAPATIKRREYQVAQAARGGTVREVKGTSLKAKVSRGFKRRFRSSARLGVFTPKAGTAFGFASGMLASSAAVVHTGKGVYEVFFAASRGRFADKKSGKTAVQRVFERIGLWTQRAMDQPSMRKVMAEIVKARIANAQAALGKSLMDMIRQTQELAAEVEAAGEDE